MVNAQSLPLIFLSSKKSYSLLVGVILMLLVAPIIKGQKTSPPRPTSNEPALSLAEERLFRAERQRIATEEKQKKQLRRHFLLSKQEKALTAPNKLWQQFRSVFPFHIQTIGLSEAASDKSRTLLISEPPPHVSLEDILEIVGDALLSHQVKQQRIGYDGWVRDVVIVLRSDEMETAGIISALQQALFFTSYKSYVQSLPVTKPVKQYDLDLTVTSDELRVWLLAQNENFLPVEGGATQNLSQISNEMISRVWHSERRGLTGWWIPRKSHLRDCAIQARQFALDSDIVVGAMATTNGIFILGRERIVPVEFLPPLRIETMILLADVQRGQVGMLAQSYERTHVLAGPINETEDWAPILLSPELRDTEYGSLLNITDQLLKSWSNHGLTTYINFPYDDPGSFPFNQSLPNVLATTSVTYNWNTAGAGYTLATGRWQIFALNRSGALPVSYIPEGMELQSNTQVKTAEDRAYNYYAGLSDPNLVRVVQYAALYQIFSAFDIAKSSVSLARNNQPDSLLISLTNQTLNELKNASGVELSNLANQLVPQILPKDIETTLTQKYQAAIGQAATEIEQALRNANYKLGSKAYQDKYRELMERAKQDFAKQVEVRRQEIIDKATLIVRDDLQKARELSLTDERRMRSPGTEMLSRVAALKKIPERYATTCAQGATGWIHTPVVVISSNQEIPNANAAAKARYRLVGGHNLDARVTRFIVTEQVAQGRAVKLPDGRILVHPADVPKVSRVLRTIGRNERRSSSEVTALLNADLSTAPTVRPRPKEVALNFTPPPGKPPSDHPLALNAADFGPPSRSGWGGKNGNGGNENPLLSGLIVIDRNRNQTFNLAQAEQGISLQLRNTEDVVDALVYLQRTRTNKTIPLQLALRGWTPQEAEGFRLSYERRVQAGQVPAELSAVLQGKQRLPQIPALDFTNAEIRFTNPEMLVTGELQTRIEIKVSGSNEASVTGNLLFRKGTSREIIAAITNRVRQVFLGLLREMRGQYDAVKFNLKFNQAVKKIRQRTGVEFQMKDHTYKQGSSDLYFVQRNRLHGSIPSNVTTRNT